MNRMSRMSRMNHMKHMKHMKHMTIVLVFLIAALCFVCLVYAEDIPENGFYGIGTAENLTVSPQDAEGAVSSEPVSYNSDTIDTFYPGADRLSVSLSGATEGKEYAVFLLDSEAETLSAESIYYINQATADGTVVSFNVYPRTISESTDLKLKITSNDGSTAVEVPVSYKVWEVIPAEKLIVSVPGSLTDDCDTEVVVTVEPANASVDLSVSSGSDLVTAELSGSDDEGNYTYSVHVMAGFGGNCTLTFTDLNTGLSAAGSLKVSLGADSVDMKGVALSHSIVAGKYIQFKSVAIREDGKTPTDKTVVYQMTDAEQVPLEELPAGVSEKSGKFTFKNAGIYYILVSPNMPTATSTPQFVTVAVTPVLKSIAYLDDANKKMSKLTLVAGDDAEPYDLGARAQIIWNDGLVHDEYKPAYSSSSNAILTVDEDGIVTPVSAGSAKINIELGGKKLSISVMVGVGADILKTTMALTQNVAQGKTLKINVTAAREDGLKPISTAVDYAFTDELGTPLEEVPAGTSISKGTFKSTAPGTYHVLVYPVSGTSDAQTLFFTIDVSPILKSIAVYDDSHKKLSKLAMSSEMGTFDLLGHMEHVWSNPNTDDDEFFKPAIVSSNESVVYYDEISGNLVSMNPGTASVTITLGGKNVKLSVSSGHPANQVVNSYKENKVVTTDVHTIVGKTVSLKAAVYYNGTTPIDKTYGCVSSDESVATVTKDKVKAIGVGVCEITVTPTVASVDCEPLVYTIYVYPVVKAAVLLNPDTGKAGSSLTMNVCDSELNLTETLKDVILVTWKDGLEYDFLDSGSKVPAYEVSYTIKKGATAVIDGDQLSFGSENQVQLNVNIVSGTQAKKLTLTLKLVEGI